MATQSVATSVVRACVCTTPFGVPVVPDVNMMSETSSGVDSGLAALDLGSGVRR